VVTLSLACAEYERVRALLSGAVRPAGLDLRITTLPAAEILERMARGAEFDAGEFSLADHLRLFAERRSPYVAIPVFPHRAFRHSILWVRASGDLHNPVDLRGRRIGVTSYTTTALLFLRGALEDDYLIAPSDITWVRTGKERLPLDPRGVTIEDVPGDLETLLETGKVDAITSFSTPAGARADPATVRYLFADVRRIEADYYRRTGIFPIMHVIAVRKNLYEAHPWIAKSLLDAFELARQRGAAPDDIHPYGVEPNRPTLEAARRYARAQLGLDLPEDVAELFAR
jgi:4,5-dihydroxyphthalate decarboxylase